MQPFGLLQFLIPASALATQAPQQDQYQAAMALARSLWVQGNSQAALAPLERAARIAASRKNPDDEAGALLGQSACFLRLFRYREALDTSERAYNAATLAKDDTRAGAAAVNEAAIYDQLGDEDSASAKAERAVALLERSQQTEYFAQALLSDADIQDLLNDDPDKQKSLNNHDRSISLFKRAIAVAQQAKLSNIEALGEDHLGWRLMMDGDFPNARKFLEQAASIRAQSHDPALLMTQTHLAELSHLTGNNDKALELINGVLNSKDSKGSSIVSYWPPELKGRILLALGSPEKALVYFDTAVQLADQWRRDILPAQSTRAYTDAALSDHYDYYIQTAAAIAADHPGSDQALARRALTVLIASRAWSLRDQLVAARSRQLRLPPRYYELLAELQKMQAVVTLAKNTSEQQRDRAKLQQFRFELTDLENKIGIQSQNISLSQERDAPRNSLSGIQGRLGNQDLLLSFYLGKDRSFLWTVERNQVKLYEIPASRQIAAQAHAFKDAVRTGSGSARPGAELSQMLFGKLPASVLVKRNWLIAADGALLEGIPFAALPCPASSNCDLASQHTLRLLPSEALLTGPREPATHPVFVGVADPIYNFADPRRNQTMATVSLKQSNSLSLGRLVASDREVHSAAEATGFTDVRLLTGPSASSSALAQALSQPPEILHFAVHVVSPGGKRHSDEAALALSLTPDGVPELLTRESVAALRTPGTLVVLSGCDSQQGTVLPSAGLVGLSRAWLLAGASAVLVTAWPTPDDSGTFFKVFYGHFQKAAGTVGQRAATALVQTQSEMKAGSGYRGDAAFWSAYSLISKE